MVDRKSAQKSEAAQIRHGFCLTDLSTAALTAGAVGVSVLLWVCILAVL